MAGGSKPIGDEVREFPNGKVEVSELGGMTVMRATFQPGWRWSENVKPIAGTESCQTHHQGYTVAGRLGVKLDDGTEFELGPGKIHDIPPGHDGWVVGDEPYVGVEFSQTAIDYAKKK
jgi:hypothetical protein